MGLDHGLIVGRNAPDEDGYRSRGEEIITWRKENHIHSWFVGTVQNGVDECEDAVVSKEKLAEFVSVCEQIIEGCELVDGDVYAGETFTAQTGWVTNYEKGKVLTEDSKALAELLMATQSGFFFGSTQYNEWYLKSLQEAVQAVKPVLENMAEDDTVTYWSSW
jgi:hypothetical protein